MPPLLEAGLSSAKDIARMGEDVFESRFSRELGGEMEARHIYRGAIQDDGEPEEDTD